MKKVLAGLIVLGLVSPCSAFTIRGVGTMKCDQWNNGDNWILKNQWVLGFVSGYEALTRPGISAGTSGSVSNDQIIMAITTYCKNNPNDDISDAALAAARLMNNQL